MWPHEYTVYANHGEKACLILVIDTEKKARKHAARYSKRTGLSCTIYKEYYTGYGMVIEREEIKIDKN